MAGHVAVFAALMADFKERSGRSYGALATRLHVSTSTLHRYCNGAAVPGEYAPVERFARLCGATPEELVGLHRRWLLADAERREAGNGQLAAGAVPAEVADSAADASEPAHDAAAPGPVEPDVSGPVPEPGPRRPWGRKLLIPGTVAAVAAVAVAVPLTHRHEPPAAAAPTPTRDTRPVPVTVDVLSDNWDSECGQWFYSAKPPSEVPPPPGLPDVPLWVAPVGAVPGSRLRLQLTAQGTAGQPPVVLHTLYVHVVAAKPAPKGYGYTMGSGCGGGITPASFAVDLDAASPAAHAVPGLEGAISTPAVDFPFQVSGTDSEVLDVDAGSADQDISWYLEVVWSCGDRQGRLKVDDHGKPFETIGLDDAPRYFYDGRAWSPATDF
jgi:plasmid maintenance system antidote protein VapI